MERSRSQIDNVHVHVGTRLSSVQCTLYTPGGTPTSLYICHPRTIQSAYPLVADFLGILRHPAAFSRQEYTRDRNAMALPRAVTRCKYKPKDTHKCEEHETVGKSQTR